MTENSQNSNQVKIYSSKEEELEEVKQDKKKNEKEDTSFKSKSCGTKFGIIIVTFFFLDLDLLTLLPRLFLSFFIGCELIPFTRCFLNSKCVNCDCPILGSYCCCFICQGLSHKICESCWKNESGGGGYSSGNSGNNNGGNNNDGGKWDNRPNYAGQMASGRDEYGNPTYTRYNENYAGEMPTGRDAYGNPTYG